MGDGHLGKCKDCTKRDVHLRYLENIENPLYVEKERARGREKYHRLDYKNTRIPKHRETRNVARKLRRLIDIPPEHELHHWNYNYLYDVFILDRRTHARFHKAVVFDEQTKCFMYNGTLLDTKDKHEQAIKDITGTQTIKRYE